MLRARVITAFFLVAGFLAVLFLLPHVWAAGVFALVAALAAWEWAGLMKVANPGRLLFAAFILAVCLFAWTQPASLFTRLWIYAAVFWIFLAPVWLWRGWSLLRQRWLGLGLGGLLILAVWAALVGLHARSPILLLAIMALVWVADIAAYFTGKACGKHKLAPGISPGKTWEGVGGAILGVMVAGLLLRANLAEVQAWSWFGWLGFLVLFTALSIVGDLFESLIKRQAAMKDSSQLLPGHGGVLDRIDSQISTLPLVALTLDWIGR